MLKPQSNGPSYSNHTVIDTLAVDGWAVTFGTGRRGLGGSLKVIRNDTVEYGMYSTETMSVPRTVSEVLV